jgi:hypothetical protein
MSNPASTQETNVALYPIIKKRWEEKNMEKVPYGKGRGRHKRDCDCIRCTQKRREKMEEESKSIENKE